MIAAGSLLCFLDGGRVRIYSLAAATASVALSVTLATFWVPVSWRSTAAGIDGMARRLHDAGITVQTTLVAFEGLTSGAHELRARQDDQTMDYLAPGLRAAWRQLPLFQAPVVSPSAFDFMKRVTASLHRAGVPIVAGTDLWCPPDHSGYVASSGADIAARMRPHPVGSDSYGDREPGCVPG